MDYDTLSLWRVNFVEPSKRSSISWFGSRDAAYKAAGKMKRECPGSEAFVGSVAFPKRKYALLKWLNENFN